MILSMLAYYISLAADIVVQLYVYAAIYAGVIMDWMLANVLTYVSSCVLHCQFFVIFSS